MTSSGPSDRNPIERQREDLALEQKDDRDQRPSPAQARCRITHRFRPRQLEYRRPKKLRQHLDRRPARPVDSREVEFAPAGVADFAFLDRGEPSRAQKAVDRRRPDAGPAPLLGAIRLSCGNPRRDDCETARRYIPVHFNRRDLGSGELVAQQRGEVRDRSVLHSRRDLPRQQLEQQLAVRNHRIDEGEPLTPALSPQAGRGRDPRSGRVRGDHRT